MEDQRKEKRTTNGARDPADERLTGEALARFENSSSLLRFKEITQSFVRHLHAFVSEVELTEEEWPNGIGFLTRTGHITDENRQEFILLSDVLGVSMLAVRINNKKPAEATTFGPFFVEGSPRFENGDDILGGTSGGPCFVQGRVLSVEGEPIPDARIEVWQADEEGCYGVQYDELSEARDRDHLYSDEEGATISGR